GRRPVVDAPEGNDARCLEALVGIEEVTEVRVRERDVIGPRGHGGLLVEPRDADDGQTMVLVVVGEKGEHAVRMDDLGAEHRAVPAHQLLEAGRAAHDVGELARRYATAVLGQIPLAILLDAHLCSPPGGAPDPSGTMRFSMAPIRSISI